MATNLSGYRTLIVAGLAIVAGILQGYGVVFDQSTQASLATVILALVFVAMRLITHKPVGNILGPVTAAATVLLGQSSAAPGVMPQGPALLPVPITGVVTVPAGATVVGVSPEGASVIGIAPGGDSSAVPGG
ncbi:MAG: hypothetical protein ABI305_07390 [Tepidiformaceae bacterium]